VFDLISEQKAQGTTILLVEQQAQRALAAADRTYVMRSGEVELDGSAEELAGDGQRLASAYLGGSR
jgi:branched-chain amino acid transport system ATP-binding protein